jgi:hypothetical protein
MDCRLFAQQLDDWMDGRLAAGGPLMQAHAESCPHCGPCYRDAVALQAELRGMPAPTPRPDFAAQALARAAGPAHAGRRWALPGLALAASVTLALGVAAILFALQPGPAHSVALLPGEPETVRLMFTSARPLPAATLHLSLPAHVELVGYAGRRELTWQTDLREGGNLLRLPLVARGKAGGEIRARLSHGESSRTFRVKVEVKREKAGGGESRSGLVFSS